MGSKSRSRSRTNKPSIQIEPQQAKGQSSEERENNVKVVKADLEPIREKRGSKERNKGRKEI